MVPNERMDRYLTFCRETRCYKLKHKSYNGKCPLMRIKREENRRNACITLTYNKGKGKKRAEDQTGKEKGEDGAKCQTGQNTGALGTVPTILGLSAKDTHGITQLPPSTVLGIWLKASDLASDPMTIAKVPGGSIKDRFVLSKSNTQHHHVKGNSNAEYTCDDRCLHYKSISICSHTIAAAHSNGELKWFGERRRGQETNLFQLAKHGMPLGAGRKGGHPSP